MAHAASCLGSSDALVLSEAEGPLQAGVAMIECIRLVISEVGARAKEREKKGIWRAKNKKRERKEDMERAADASYTDESSRKHTRKN